MTRLVLVLLVACGGKQPAPKGPPPFDAAGLAAELDGEMAEVARILHDRREDCPLMASELRAVIAKMTASLARAREAQQDPERARQLTTAMRTYDEAAAERMKQIDADFNVDAPCAKDAAVREAMLAMPSL